MYTVPLPNLVRLSHFCPGGYTLYSMPIIVYCITKYQGMTH